MDISPKSIPPLARFITGDIDQTPYLTGTKLIDLFNQFGFCDNYDTDFPSRWKYVEEKLEIINNTDHLSSVLEYLLDGRYFLDKEQNLETAVNYLNNIIKYDGYQAESDGLIYKIVSIDPDKNSNVQKIKKTKGKGGRPREPETEEKKKRLKKDYYRLTRVEVYKSSEAIKMLSEKYGWTKSTIETYLK